MPDLEIFKKFRAIGKTALTAYLIQSIVADSYFMELSSLFGYVNRAYQLVIVFFKLAF